MKIGIHANEMDGRGLGRVCRDYAHGLKTLGHDVVFLTSSANEVVGTESLNSLGPLITYEKKVDQGHNNEIKTCLERIVDAHRIDFFHMIVFGLKTGMTPDNCRTGVHAVFSMAQPHGTVYAGVSEYLCKRFYQTQYVPHVLQASNPTEDWRRKYDIPSEATVFGRHGGPTEFNIPFVHQSIFDALEKRDDLYFLFLSTDCFIEHERAIFVPWVETAQEVASFIHACDGMIHARAMGETFGLACGEFSAAGKPILSYCPACDKNYDKAHLENFQANIFPYTDEANLLDALLRANGRVWREQYYGNAATRFSEAAVMDIYEEKFLGKHSVMAPKKPELHKISMQSTVHAVNWKRWLGHLAGKPRVVGLEVGTFQGESAEWMCQNICTDPSASYWCVDHFEGSVEHHEASIDCRDLEKDTRERLARFPQAHILKGYSQDVLRRLVWLLERLDFCYIDGSHTAQDVLRDAVLCYDLLKPGGILIFDDVEWHDMPRELDQPKPGVDAFLSAYAASIEVLEPRGWQIAVKKKEVPAVQSNGEKPVTDERRHLSAIFEAHGSDKGLQYHDYGDVYEHLLAKYRDQPISLLEIGVYEGASMKSWLEYFTHDLAMIIGVDLGGNFDPKSNRARIEHGDQTNPVFLTHVDEMHGPFDIIIDDGSHKSHHQQYTFENMWASLKAGGVYIIEDLEVSYKPEFNDGDRVPTMEYFKAKITADSIKVGKADRWVLFAGELIAIFKK